MKKELRVKIVGIGGAGGKIISRMPRNFPLPVNFVALNCDLQDLRTTNADIKVQLGKNKTKGFGAGMDPKIGRESAIESKKEIENIFDQEDIIFLICGLGGGTGSGASPIVGEIAKNTQALTIGIATYPFYFEGAKRKKIAQKTIPILERKLDSLILIYNDKVLTLIKDPTNIKEAFFQIDKAIYEIIFGILSLITSQGLININLADLKSILRDSKRSFFGIGYGEGKDKIQKAVEQAINSPFLEGSTQKSRGILFYVAGGKNLTLFDVEQAASLITKKTLPEAKIIFGALQDEKKFLPDQVQVTIIASGI